MSSRIRFSSFILSGILLSSCVTDRIQFAQRDGLDCKTPETRYDFGEKTRIREIKSGTRKNHVKIYYSSRKGTHNDFSSLKRGNKYYREVDILKSGTTKDFNVDAGRGITKSISSETMSNNPGAIIISRFEIIAMPVPEQINIKSPEVLNVAFSEKPLFKKAQSGNAYDHSLVLSQMDANEDLLPDLVQPDKVKEKPFHRKSDYVLLMALLAGLIPLAALRAMPRLANNISFWAATNPWKTRFIFAGAQIALGTSGFLIGERLADSGIQFTELSKEILLGTFLTSTILYPVRYTSFKLLKHSYIRQKAFDLALAISGFMLMVNAGNDPSFRASVGNIFGIQSAEQQVLRTHNDYNPVPGNLMLYQQNESQFQEPQQEQLQKEPSKGLKIFYTFLTVLAALILGYLLAAAACGIACNGMEGLAYLVGIGGGILLLTLAILVIRRIWHRGHRRKANPAEPPGSIQTDGTLQV